MDQSNTNIRNVTFISDVKGVKLLVRIIYKDDHEYLRKSGKAGYLCVNNKSNELRKIYGSCYYSGRCTEENSRNERLKYIDLWETYGDLTCGGGANIYGFVEVKRSSLYYKSYYDHKI